MTTNEQDKSAGFYGLGIAPKLLAELDAMKFTEPTPIQRQAIPIACEGKDLAGIAQTGTGKTIAFAIPMLQSLAAKPGRGLVLVPTRELALQVNSVFAQFAPLMGMRTVVLIGGESINPQKSDLRRNPQVIIATPGRLIDHLEQRTVRLSDVRVLVLDEADRMLDMGFAPQIERIIRAVPAERQTMLFSATMPDQIMKLAGAYMRLPVRVEVARSGTAAEKVIQEVFVVNRADKSKLLGKLLDKYWGSVLLFSRTKHNARKIARAINAMGHTAAEIHSNRSLGQRKAALEGFKTGKHRVLVATDIAARGIDVTGIELVINYDLPDDYDNYVHRIGRTGRAGREGRAISFATPEQGGDVRGIERLIRMSLPVSTHPDMPPAQFSSQPQPQARQNSGGQQRRSSNRPRRDFQRRANIPPAHDAAKHRQGQEQHRHAQLRHPQAPASAPQNARPSQDGRVEVHFIGGERRIIGANKPPSRRFGFGGRRRR